MAPVAAAAGVEEEIELFSRFRLRVECGVAAGAADGLGLRATRMTRIGLMTAVSHGLPSALLVMETTTHMLLGGLVKWCDCRWVFG